MEGLPWKDEIYTFLLNYRATTHLTTGKSPANLFFSDRPFRTRLGNFKNFPRRDDDVRAHDQRKKLKMKNAADKKRYVKHSSLKEGDIVLSKLEKINKLTPSYDPLPYTITKRKGTMITAERKNPSHHITRDVSQFKKLKFREPIYDLCPAADINTNPQERTLRRSERTIRAPVRYPQREEP